MTSHPDRCRVFHDLHASGCFVIPNPWDVGSARALASLGFKALATTSSGFAFTLGRADGNVTLDEVVDFYNDRFTIGLTKADRADLAAFLGAL